MITPHRGSSMITPHRGSSMIARLVFALLLLVPAIASAHGFRPGVLALSEESPGVFAIAWTEPVDTRRGAPPVTLAFPAACTHDRDRLDCGSAGLHGEIAFVGLEAQRAPVTTVVRFLDGREREAMVTPDAPRFAIEASPGSSAAAWIELGVRHIFGGLDHLAFLLGLLLVVGASNVRLLVLTITAFTLAHSITLGLGATGLVTLAPAPVEAAIAASVVLVGYEALHTRPTLTRRAPWAVALGFGLVHGLGFASALTSAGLPPGHVGLSLLAFNAGVELGQLAIVLAALALVRLLPRGLDRSRRVACYAVGGAGAWWLLDRTLAIVTAAS